MTDEAMLQLGPDLAVPLDVVTQPLAIMGVRRSGKSNAAAVLAEEMFDHDLPWVAIDPKGDWWGLRLSADGTGAGLPIPIFGGLRGDMPLAPEAGALMADLIFEHNLTCVFDVSRFSIAARSRFLVAFGDRLFELHQADPQPRFVFLEEAHRILPQQVRAEMAHCVGTWTKIIAEGGGFGLGIGILDQRCATVNKDGLTQIEAMLALRTTSPQDRKAIHDWMVHHALAAELTESLPSLASGEAWVSSSYWLPLHGQPAIQRLRFRQRRTFDSGATPVVGQARRVATLPDIDLAALSDRMAAVVEHAEQNDPAKLRRKIADLERKLAQRGSADPQDLADLRAGNDSLRAQLAAALNRPAERIDVPVLTPGDAAALEQSIAGLRDVAGSLELALSRASRPAPAPAPARPAPPPQRVPERRAADPVTSSPAAPAGALPKAQRAILTVLAQFPEGRTKRQLAMLASYSAKGGGFNNSLSSLRSSGLIERGEPIRVTDAGLTALGTWEPLPEGAALIEHWMGQLSKSEAEALRVLLAAWPESLTKAEIAARTDRGDGQPYSADGGGFNNALSRLRTLQLIDGYGEIRADDTLAQAAKVAVLDGF